MELINIAKQISKKEFLYSGERHNKRINEAGDLILEGKTKADYEAYFRHNIKIKMTEAGHNDILEGKKEADLVLLNDIIEAVIKQMNNIFITEPKADLIADLKTDYLKVLEAKRSQIVKNPTKRFNCGQCGKIEEIYLRHKPDTTTICWRCEGRNKNIKALKEHIKGLKAQGHLGFILPFNDIIKALHINIDNSDGIKESLGLFEEEFGQECNIIEEEEGIRILIKHNGRTA